MTWIWERADWPAFAWDDAALAPVLGQVRHQQGWLLGRMEALGLAETERALLENFTDDVLKTSDIEGERLDERQVRSSLARRLGIDVGALAPADRRVEAIVEITLDATQRFAEPLTAERLLGWHATLFPTGRSGLQRIRTGAWRDDAMGPMQVVSGPVGRERVHYVAPPAGRVEAEVRRFLDWFERPPEHDPVLVAALAHLWFVTIHPFDDGNGRIARAVSDLALARSENGARRFYSMSSEIRSRRSAYYAILERTQSGTLDVTPWMVWFLECLRGAIATAKSTLSSALRRGRFWQEHAARPLNDRQRRILSRLLEGFEGKLTSSRWARLAKCSQDTALRDIEGLLDLGILRRGPAGGRSTSYELVWPGGEEG